MAAVLPTIHVTTVSDDPLILDVFRFKLWDRDEGIDHLLGIYKDFDLPDGSRDIVTLDGKRYNTTKHQDQIQELFERHDRLVDIWEHSTKRPRYSPVFFIRWGMLYRDICPLSWIEDAQDKGLLPKPKEKPVEIHHSERTTLLKIIAGLTLVAYEQPKHGLKAEIGRDLQERGLGVNEETLNKHLGRAWEEFIPPSKP